MQPACLTLRVVPGATLRNPLLLMQPEYAYRDIAGIAQQAPLQLQVPGHGLVGEWPTWVEGATGWVELNRDKHTRPFRMARVIDADTIEFNAEANNGQALRGGRLVYQLPVELTGIRAALTITGAQGLATAFTTDNGGLVLAGPGRLVLVISAAEAAALPRDGATYSLDITWSNGDVSRWLQGSVEINEGGCCHA